MPDNVTADPAHLNQLAQKQDTAAAGLRNASNATDGIVKKVWITHGCYVGAANTTLDKAETARKAAGEAMQAVSTALAKQLRAAGVAYASTDTAAADNVDRQVLDGGNLTTS
jgi:hypothetical protein